jgi:hypothetical protein
MTRRHMRIGSGLICILVLNGIPAVGQTFFAAPADFGGRTGTGLFQADGGVVTRINTGFVEHNFPQVSRSGTVIAFSSPDPVEVALQVPPSSDIYVFSRITGQTVRVVDHNTIIFNPGEVASFTPVSAAVSPNNQLVAYGVVLTRRQGTANPRSTRELNIARVSDGLILDNPTFGRGPVSDAFQAEFVGISWDPGGESLVTTTYVSLTSAMGQPIQLPAVVRYSRTPGTNDWDISAILSTPQYLDNQFPPSATTAIYPALSPSGAAVAYFELFWPDALGSSQPVVARIITANADGSNARTLFTFNQGFYPAGLSWSPDGTQLAVAFSNQLSIGTGFLPSAEIASSVIRQVSTETGQMTSMPGVDTGLFPSWNRSSSSGSITNARLAMVPAANGGFRLIASGLVPGETYLLQSSSDLDPGGFGSPQSLTGEQLMSGINVAPLTSDRFFRLINPSSR